MRNLLYMVTIVLLAGWTCGLLGFNGWVITLALLIIAAVVITVKSIWEKLSFRMKRDRRKD